MLVFMTIFVGEMQIVFSIIHDMSVLREWEQYIYFVFIDEFQYPKVFSFGVFSKDGVSQADVRYQFLFTFSPFPLLVLSLSTISFLFLFPQWRKKTYDQDQAALQINSLRRTSKILVQLKKDRDLLFQKYYAFSLPRYLKDIAFKCLPKISCTF